MKRGPLLKLLQAYMQFSSFYDPSTGIWGTSKEPDYFAIFDLCTEVKRYFNKKYIVLLQYGKKMKLNTQKEGFEFVPYATECNLCSALKICYRKTFFQPKSMARGKVWRRLKHVKAKRKTKQPYGYCMSWRVIVFTLPPQSTFYLLYYPLR